MKTEKKSEAGFEQDLEKLEAIVETLEAGGLPLEKSLKEFETGIQADVADICFEADYFINLPIYKVFR